MEVLKVADVKWIMRLKMLCSGMELFMNEEDKN